jgi:hypothetical protein
VVRSHGIAQSVKLVDAAMDVSNDECSFHLPARLFATARESSRVAERVQRAVDWTEWLIGALLLGLPLWAPLLVHGAFVLQERLTRRAWEFEGGRVRSSRFGFTGDTVTIELPCDVDFPAFTLTKRSSSLRPSVGPRIDGGPFDARWKLVIEASPQAARAIFPTNIGLQFPSQLCELDFRPPRVVLRFEHVRDSELLVKDVAARMDLFRHRLGRTWPSRHALTDRSGTATRVKGSLRGHPVVVHLRVQGPPYTHIHLRRRVPFTMVHRDHGEGEPTNNPLIDQLVAVTGDISGLQDMPLLEACLELTHGFPGSEIQHKGLSLEAKGVLDGEDLRKALDLVVRVAELLDR